MNWKFTFKHLDSSTSLQSYTQDQFEKVSALFTDRLLKEGQWHVFYSAGKFDHSVEVFVSNSHGKFKVKAVTKDSFYAAVDLAAEKLSRQFYKHKEKMQDHNKFERSKQGRLERVNELLEYDHRPYRHKKPA